jgi:hypothetical protein
MEIKGPAEMAGLFAARGFAGNGFWSGADAILMRIPQSE